MNTTIKTAVANAAGVLANGSLNEARYDATLLLMHVLGRDRAFVIAHADETVSPVQMQEYQSLVARRAAGQPLQYLTGHQEFFKLDFEVSADVLIPRPETELIVEVALDLLRSIPEPTFVDLGTGSGCIAISLLHELPEARGIAVDISAAALAVARRNAERHGALSRLQFVESDLLAGLDQELEVALIVSNPPYIPTRDLVNLQREVHHEPQGALDGGPDGLDLIRRLLRDSPAYLKKDGYLVFEIGFDQAGSISQLVDIGVWEFIEIREDLQGIPRTVVLRLRDASG